MNTFFNSIDEYVKTEMQRLGIPGLALGIVHDNEVVHLLGLGAADSTGKPVTPQTLFHIGSITKSFTALAVMQLAEIGKIDLDAPVQWYLPWFTLAEKDAAAQITIRHLLNQSSGISEKNGNRFWDSAVNMEEAVRRMSTVKLSYPVGTKFQYCNMNYVILGLIIEQVSGQSYADYVNEHIFMPLGMRNSFTSHAAAATSGLAEGHYYLLGRANKRDGIFPPAYLATGLMVSNAEDMTHYIIAQLNDGKYGSGSVLSSRGIAELHTPAIPMMGQTYFAMGWAVGPQDGLTTIKLNGDIVVSHSSVMIQPESKWGIVLLANATGFEQIRQVDEIARGVINLLNEKQAVSVKLPLMYRFLYWGILSVLLLQVLGIIGGLLLRQNWVVGDPWQIIVTVVLNLAIAFIFLFKIPGLIPFPLSSMRVYYPELGYALISGGVIGIGWSLIDMLIRLVTK